MATARILVVDDEPTVLDFVSKALSLRGHEVHVASGPFEALKLVHDAPCFDLVVSDAIMPEICGPELVGKIKQICPDTAVVMMSAHIVIDGHPKPAGFINKPFRVTDLYTAVEKTLARSLRTLGPEDGENG